MHKQLCQHYYISGKVQGVWFRVETKKQADLLQLHGWVKNLPDGRVEVLACGDSEKLSVFRKWLAQGPPLAQVEKVEEETWAWQELKGFLIK